jgi:hypothetical protein
MTREPDGTLSFRTSHGRLLPAVPPPDPVPVDPVDDLRAQNTALGVHIDPHTAKPSWLGERLDLGYAIDVLHPLASTPVSCANCDCATSYERKRAGGSA